ncbi:UNC-50 family-domain-containing protein [Lobosporangium transversale]|uniref:UNC-50 family-domain-containing protein n=1 Tax=Lobosporangium transversale TaxID=64571 RepID=A0A1Y2GNL7_9FUNG|nr:UNC-50 family-domain-containing protein [Lobosporangium transversale]ORZ16699.1 UNC-50 family-domain-containing protein [Lobosporangium transversale]|eukprot:XP_021881634.1 UNC-50 family-domain-containing protein [Lobosporangium transversale]
MTILPLNSTPGRNTPTQQNASYFPTQGGPTIGIPSAYDAYGGRKADAGSGYGFGGMSSASNSSSSGRIHHGGRPHGSGGISGFVPLFLRRLFRFPHMDFQFALWQMVYLCISPRIVYRNIHYHKQTKNQWARDDPAFMVILSGILGCSAIAWGLVYGHGMMGILRMMLYMVFVDFVVIGLIVATICWTIANRFLTRVSVYSTDQTVEWQYAFDIHCNAFMPVIALLYIIQMVFMKVLLKDFWICSLLGNTLYLTAIVYYCYITFLGYNALPFVRHPEMFLYPITIFVIFYVIVLILGVNISAKVLTLYFG